MGKILTPEELKLFGVDPLAPKKVEGNIPAPAVTPNTLSPKHEIKADPFGNQPVNPDTSINDETFKRSLDTDDTNVIRQEDPQVFDGSSYLPQRKLVDNITPGAGIRSNPPVEKMNQDIYESVGKPMFDGIEGGPRLQEQTDDTGAKTGTTFVPPPSFGPVERSVTGAILEAIKSTGEFFSEGLSGGTGGGKIKLEPDSKSGKIMFHLLDADAPMTDYIKKNMPTMPANGPVEKAAQEIGSFVIGATLGGGAIKTITKLPEIEQAIASTASKFLSAAAKKDPVNAVQKTTAAIQAMATEYLGANVGGTITTPDNTVSITQQLADNMGIKVDEKLGNLVDNTVLSGAFHALGAILGGTSKGVKKLLNVGDNPTEQRTALAIFQKIDPHLVGATPEEQARRIKLFSSKVQENSVGDLGDLGEFKRGTNRSVVESVKSYYEDAYSFMKPNMSPEEWTKFVTENAGRAANEIEGIRRSAMHLPIVQDADARMLGAASDVMTNKAAEYGTEDTTRGSIDALGQPIIAKNTANQTAVQNADLGVKAADAAANTASTAGAVLQRLNTARLSSAARSTATEDANITADAVNMKNKHEKSFTAYNEAFNNLPANSGDVDWNKMAGIITKHANSENDIAKLIGINDSEGSSPFKIEPVSDAERQANITEADKLAQKFSEKDLKWLYTEVRPYLSDYLNKAQNADGSFKPKQTAGIVELKKFIDDTAKQTGDARWGRAMGAYEKHAKVYGGLPEMRQYDDLAKKNVTSGGLNDDEVIRKGAQEIKTKLDTAAQDPTGIGLKHILKAAGGNRFQQAETVANYVIKNAASSAVDTDKRITSQQLESAFSPYRKTLQTLNQGLSRSVDRAIDDLRLAESGVTTARQSYDSANEAATKYLNDIKETAAKQFVDSTYSHIEGDAIGKMNKMFSSAEDTTKLINEAEATGDPNVLEGIQSQFLRDFKERYFTNKGVNVDVNRPGNTIKEASGAKINALLDGSNTTPRDVMKEVFRNKPKVAEDLTLLMKELQGDFNSRMTKPSVGGSDTALNLAGKSDAVRTLITLSLGRLNRAATTAQTIASRFGALTADMKADFIDKVLPKMLVDVDYFTSTLDKIATNPDMKEMQRLVKPFAISTPSALTKGALNVYKPEPKKDDTNEALGVK